MLQGKTALVTGSTSGIGLGIARSLASEGCAVMLNGFGDPVEIVAIRKEISEQFKVPVKYNRADLSKAAEVSTLVAATVDELGGIDILVNNAGIQHTAPVTDFPAAMWDKIIAIMLTGAFHTIRHASPHMQAKGWGRIINTSSVHGLVASVHKSAYVAAKHGIMGLTKTVALEMAGQGITCNAINPGFVRTELVQVQIDDRAQKNGASVDAAARDMLLEKQPSLEFVTPEQIGALCVFLCSESAAQITGVPIPIDGGWTAQ